MSRMFRALQSSGVVFTPIHPITFCSSIEDLKEGREVTSFPYSSVSLIEQEVERRKDQARDAHSRVNVITRSCSISWQPNNDTWILGSWEGHPGPIEQDFIAEFSDLEPLLEALQEYYFGPPTIINGWVVPLQHHPELEQSKVTQAISRAKQTTRSDFLQLKAEADKHIEHLAIGSAWSSGKTFFFLKCSHEMVANQLCYLRRDASESYIVIEEY